MTQKRFTFIKDTVATNLKTPIVYNNEKMSIGEVLEMLNNLYDKNEQLEHQLRSCNETTEKRMKYDCKHHIGQFCIKYKTRWFLCSSCLLYEKRGH